MIPEETPQLAAAIAKTKLKKYLPLKREVERQRARLEALYGPRIPRNSGMPHGSGISDPTADAAPLIMERKKRLHDKEMAFASFESAIEKDMEILTPTERDLIRAKYMDGLKWEEVCVIMSYSWAQIHRIHSAALIKLGNAEIKAQG